MVRKVDVGGAAMRVLVVDDDPAIRATLRELLEDEGYEVDEAAEGGTALALLRAQPLVSFVVLTDHQMPRMDGAQMLRRVAANPALAARHAYLYMTAGNRHDDPQVRRVLAALDVPVIRKPFDVDEIVAAVDAAVRRIAPVPSLPGCRQGEAQAAAL